MRVELGQLGFDEGGALLIKRALRLAGPNGQISVSGSAPDLSLHLRSWCRIEGHGLQWLGTGDEQALITAASNLAARWSGAERTGSPDPFTPNGIAEHAPQSWRLSARGALIERGSPEFAFTLSGKIEVWSMDAGRIYAQGAAAQWDPATAIPWDTKFDLPFEVEDAIVQIMTYLIENETAALLVPSRLVSQLHPHFREVMQVLALQAADEARHIEVFTRRALLKRKELGLSTAGGQTSLKTLVEEPDFAIASFFAVCSGRGHFPVAALVPRPTRFGSRHSHGVPARCTERGSARRIRHGSSSRAYLAGSRHSVQARKCRSEASRCPAEHRWAKQEVFDALLLVASGGWDPSDLRRSHENVMGLLQEMDELRQKRMVHIGFSAADARELSALHTRNFM